MTRTLWTTLLAAALAAPLSDAGQTWTFDVTTTGQDVMWTSPTSVDPAASVYAVEYQLTKVEVNVTWLGIPFNNIDVTGQVPPELQSAMLDVPGPAPISLLNQSIVIPPAPAPVAFGGTLSFGLDAGGFGFANATGVTLGTLVIDLGGIFGMQTVTLTSVRLVGQLSIHAAWYDLGHSLAGSQGIPSFVGSGPLISGDPITLTLSNAAPSAPTLFVVGLSQIDVPFEGGIMVPSLDAIIPVSTDGNGVFTLTTNWPNGVPPNLSLYMQCWVLNVTGTAVDGASNGLRAVAQ